MNKSSFKPSSRLTFTTVQGDRQRLLQWCRDLDDSVLQVDLSEVSHCDSAGLALLIEAKRLGREMNKSCAIIGIPPSIFALAQFCGVDVMLDVSTV